MNLYILLCFAFISDPLLVLGFLFGKLNSSTEVIFSFVK